MSKPLHYIDSHIYESGTAGDNYISIPAGFRQLTVTTQALDITGSITNVNIEDIITEANAVPSASMSGTITLKATPPRSFTEYELPEGSIDLAAPSFLSTDVPIETLIVTLDSVAGSSHVAVTVTCYS